VSAALRHAVVGVSACAGAALALGLRDLAAGATPYALVAAALLAGAAVALGYARRAP